MKNIIKEVAKAHGTSEQEVRNEMRGAIRAAMKSTDPTAQGVLETDSPGRKRTAGRKGHCFYLPDGSR